MWGTINYYQQSSLRAKFIIAFTSFIIISFVIIGGTLSWLFIDCKHSMILKKAILTNDQIIQNIDNSLSPVIKLSMYPLQDKTLMQLMRKDYAELSYPLYERERDYDIAGSILKSSMLSYSELIDTAVIYQNKNRMILARSNDDYMNHDYLENEFPREKFVHALIDKNGQYLAIGVHPDRLMSYDAKPVVSIGRAIVDPSSKKQLGLIILNFGIEKLEKFWNNVLFTKSTSFYLIDESHRIIYSEQKNEIGKFADDIIGTDFVQTGDRQSDIRQNGDHFMIVSTSGITNWQAITVIPKKEVFGFANKIVRTFVISLLVLLGLEILTSLYIMTGISYTPLNRDKKMKLVPKDNLDMVIDILQGEVGKISITIDDMLQEIRRLIVRFYGSEQDKRQFELMALQSQIKPHFMYNTLNAIKWMAKIQGSYGIEEALTAFSSLIRYTAKTEGDYVTIAEEVAFIQDYIKILEYRYFNKFDVTYEIDPQLLSCYTLKFLLQPLIENAVFHGFDGIDYKGDLHVRIYIEAGSLVLSVTDNGKGLEGGMSSSYLADQLNEIGVQNIRKRIELHFGDGYGLELINRLCGGTVAKVVVPIICNLEEVNNYENYHRR